jgi:hypothetical protein
MLQDCSIILMESWKKLIFESADWIKKIHPKECGWAPSSLFRAWIEQKRQRKWGFYLCLLERRHPSSHDLGYQSFWLLGLRTLGLTPNFLPHPGVWPWSRTTPLTFLVFSPLDLDRIIPQAFLGLQFVGGILWDFLSFICMWATSHNESIWFCSSGNPNQTQFRHQAEERDKEEGK